MNFQANTDQETYVSPLFEVRRTAGFDTGEISGYASTFNGPVDTYGTVFAPGAFSASLSDHRNEGTSPVMLWAHDRSDVIGKWTSIREDSHGLHVEGKLNLSTQRGRDAFNHLKAGDLSGLSVGILMEKNALKSNSDGTKTISKAHLFEISVVGVPSNKGARITQVRSLASKQELVELLRNSGLPKAAAARIASGGWTALAGVDQQRVLDLAQKLSLQTQMIRNMK